MELAGKVALVTGAGQGIGRACALRLAREGAEVGVNDLDAGRAAAVACEVEALGRRAVALPADVGDEAQVEAMVARVVTVLGGLDILVNNAGLVRASLAERLSSAEWDRGVSVTLGGAFRCSRAAIAPMRARGGGRIVNIASIAARNMAYHGGVDYTASKWGILGLTRHLAFELGRDRIAVNAVCPGLTLTPLVLASATEEERAALARRAPLGEAVRPEDIAEAVLFFASAERARLVTGASLDVDAGLSVAFTEPAAYFARRGDVR
ncbi:MAG: hypothetical protein A2X52_07330 [Candidatus Rokubacteria bacterium GWC2_70_16]|nr:MAG: hypothetical protein A2X52_07330 [Candidatus Rokubacteria bacterium GWC2_70_16]OGL19780.1 MAG: hypothetical protein A3K12_07495 [Candidatus Rokubacteria bacterium RIFCSPLOWO2_12_FULL_71_19]